MSHRITPTKAIALIVDFVQHPTLGSISQNMGLGGTFTKSVFNKFATNEPNDLLLWFCYRQVNGGVPAKFFIALEPEPTAINPSSLPATPVANTLAITNDHFYYSGSNNAVSIESFFRNQTGLQTSNSSISKTDVTDLSSEFLSRFPSGSSNPYNASKLGYFRNDPNNDVANFIAQSNEIAGVRYFFAFDSSETNKIKVIFVPIDSQGKNIVAFTNGVTPFYLDRIDP